VVVDLKLIFFFSSRRRHTISKRDWSSDVCSSDLDFTDCLNLLNEWATNKEENNEFDEGMDDESVGIKKIFNNYEYLKDRLKIARSEERRVGKEGRAKRWTE